MAREIQMQEAQIGRLQGEFDQLLQEAALYE